MKKYAVLADTHFGSGDERENTAEVMQQLRAEGYTLILNGDVLDLWRDKQAGERYRHLISPDDILITGNHDYGLEGYDTRTHLTLTVGERTYFITHGDVVDFVYGFAQLERARRTGRGPLLARVGALLRDWNTEDVLDFYLTMRDAPEWAIRTLEHGRNGWLKRLQAFVILARLAVTRFATAWPVRFTHKPPLDKNFLDQSTFELYSRVCGFYPKAFMADTMILGHLHKQRDEAPVPGKRLILLGAWVKQSTPSVALIGEEGCELRSYP